ncbi:MAG: phosphodiester glycosidase family protein [Hyphomicrobiales bacterium]|nr:phosphodiester glycosidase family protein [Hyphomicrobiales bacterium]
MRFLQHLRKALVAIFATAAFCSAAKAGPCEKIEEKGSPYVVCAFDPAQADIRLFLRNDKGDLFGAFEPLADDVAAHGGKLVFAMNAGMFMPDYSPVGLYMEKRQELRPINRANGAGNFNLKPNGIFWVRGATAGVTETQAFQRQNFRPDYATQSGPMLVVNGKIHPKIRPDGMSLKTRNGVGQCADGKIRFAISDDAVSFYDFAALFRDRLKCPNALFLDGSVSSLYAPDLKRNDGWRTFGPIVGVTEGLKK